MKSQSPAPPSPSMQVRNTIARRLARLWTKWGCPVLAQAMRVDFTNRLGKAVARCNPRRCVIRVSLAVLAPQNRRLLTEILTHEAAHAAVYHLHGPKARPHGNEWRQLMRGEGLEPRLRLTLPDPPTRAEPRRRPGLRFEYRCPVCQSVCSMRRRDSRIRCRPCVEAGLEGLMIVTRRPASEEPRSL